MKLIVLDTETTNSLDDPFMYDIGWVVTDSEGHDIVTRSYVVEEIFMNKELMASAYFAEKRPQYWDEIENGKRTLAPLWKIRAQLAEDCKAHDISIISVQRTGTGDSAAAGEGADFGPACGVERLDLPCLDLPGHQLSLCAGDQHSPELLCGDRRSQSRGCPDQGVQLPGDSVPGEDDGVRQDRDSDPGRLRSERRPP